MFSNSIHRQIHGVNSVSLINFLYKELPLSY
jgi:hypothetical protein